MEMAINFPNLGIYLEHVGNTLEIYGVSISYFGILIACSVLLATAYILMWVRRTGQNPNIYLSVIVFSGIGAVIGARLCYVVFYLDLMKKDISLIWRLRDGGLALYGAIAGGILIAWLISIISKTSLGKMLDTICMGVLFVQIAGRIGDFFNRECFGEYTNSLLAMQIPVSMVRQSELTPLIQENLVTVDNVSYIQVHPAFLYESLWCLFLFFLLMWYRKRRQFDGELFLVYLMCYSVGRIGIEYLRTDKLIVPGTDLPFFLITAACLTVICLIIILVGRAMAKKRKESRKRMQEALYLAEEKAGAEIDAVLFNDMAETKEVDLDQLLENNVTTEE